MEKTECEYYQSLYEIAAVVNSARDPESVLHYIVENVTHVMGVKGCSLMLLAPNKKLLLHTTAYGLSGGYIRKGPVLVDKSISETLAGKPVAILDAAEDERIQYPEQAKKEGIASILSVPIMLRGEVKGLFRVYTSEPRHFSVDEIYFVGAVADLCAVALENAKRYTAEWRATLGYEPIAKELVAVAR